MRVQELLLNKLNEHKERCPQKRITLDIQEIEKNYRIEPDGRILAIKSGRYLKPIPNTAGHFHVCLFKYKRDCMIQVARLVAEKFLGERPPKAKINHIDFNISNNNNTNLEYSTHAIIVQRSYSYSKRVFHNPR